MARVLLVAALALLWVGFGPTSAEAANPAADIEQCRNGQFGSPEQCTGGAWQTGNAGASNSHYREGDSVPFRAVLTNLSTSGTHSVVIEYDTLDSGAHAYDYLTSFDRTETTAAPCSGISPCVPGSAGAIPVDPTIAFANPDSTQVSGAISIWNGAITSVAYGSADAAGKRSVTVSFTATDARVVVAWGGHIASQIDWGAGNSAGSISGSPYHMRLLDLDGDGLGNMDRSLSAASVAPVPATFTTQVSSASITLGQPVTDLASLSGPNGVVSGNVSFFVCGPDVVSNPSCASGGSAVGSAVGLAGGQATSPQFVPTQAGKYCFRAEYAPDMFAQYSPSEHTNLTTECFEAVLPLGTLRVIKKVVNDNGGSKAAGDFNLHVKSGSADVLNSPAAGSATGVVYTLASGSYTVSEDTPPAGYAQTGFSGDCDAGGVVTVAAGVEKTCTITNDDQAAKLVVFKHVVNDNGGGKIAGDFPITVTGSSPSPASFNGSESGTQVAIQPGSFSVSETEDAGYAASYAGCSGSIALGETKTCTITNDDKAAKLVVIKHVINDNGGGKVAGDFPISVTGSSPSPASFNGSESGTDVAIGPGAFSVTETVEPGYAASYVGCTGTIALGQTKTCTITNDDQAAKLVVVKHVVNDNGGGKVAGDFPISVTGSSPSPASFNGSESGTQVAIQPGSFSVSETEDAGYAASYAGCSGSIALGETKTCTITNDDKAAKLVVIKHVINDEGGTRAASDFAITVTGGSPAPASFSGAEAPGTDVAIGPGSYEVTEGAHAGYEVSYSDGCAGSIALGQTKTCTITNDDDVAPSVTVEKTASPTSVAEPGGMVAFSITVVNTSKEAVTLTSLTDDVYGDLDGKGTCLTGGSLAASDGAPGGPDEYSCAFSANVDGNAGSTHTDVVTAIVVDDEEDDASDTDDAVVRITDVPGSIVVTKTADPVSLPEPGGNVTFSVEIDNTSASDAVTISSLVDDVYGNLDAKGTCDVPVTIAVGASYSCSFQGEVEGNAGSAHTDVVTASGTDDDGTPVADDDDAVVTLTNTPSSIVVTKTADPVSLPEPGGNATFSVKVDNTSAVDAVMISSLTDDIYGNLDGKGTCDVPKTIAAGASYSCSFQGAVSGNAGSSHKDVVTASGSDDDGNAVSDDDDATVTLTNLPSSIAVTKTADPVSLPEPGGNASFSVKVENTSATDAVTISSLTDDVYGNLDGKGTCDVPQTIPAGQSYSCSFQGAVSGNAGSSHKDVVSATGSDDDGNPVSGQDDAVVTIVDVPGSIAVTKTADPVSLPEPGGNASFSVKVENTSAVDAVTISSLADDVYGNLDGKGSCDVPQTIAAGQSYTCSFDGAVSGNAGSSHKDVVTASGNDDDGNALSDHDDAIVAITNVASSIAVTKSADPVSLPEPGGQATFSVKVENTSAVDSVTISSLADDVYGNLDGKGTCDVPKTIAAGASYNCSFQGAVSGNAGSSHKDVVTASGTDDDGNPLSGQDDAVVSITNVASSIAVTKTASPTSIQEPGGQVAFSVKVDNTSATDAVTISGLVDDVFGNLDGKGTCDVPRTIAAGSSYSCSFSANVSGTGGSTHRDVVTASGSDDDGNPVSAQDDATVAITSAPVPPPPAPPAPPAPLAPPAPPAPKAIDLSIVKTDRPDPVFVGGRLTYTLSVRNAGPDTATNVSLADPLPAGTRFVSVRTTQGSCNGGPLVTCNLGSIAPASRVLVTIVVRALEAGALINTATVVGNEPEANTANNSSTAPTLVRGPFRPPVVTCPALTVQPRTLALGKKGVVKAVVTRAGKGVRGVRIVVSGPGLKKAATTDGRGRVGITVRPPRAGIATIRMANEPARCSTRRVGVVGVFLPPPVTG